MSVDTISNFLTIIRNAINVSKRTIVVPYSNICFAITKILYEEGFIAHYKQDETDKHYKVIVIQLKYENGESVIHEITRVSRPGRRHYEKVKNLVPVIGGLGISILSTNAGVLTDKQAKKLSVGGEVICRVW